MNEKSEIVDRSKAVCKYCNAELKYLQASTTNMQHHYNTFHLLKFTSEDLTVKQPTIASAFGKPKEYSTTSARHLLLQKCVAEFIIHDLLLFSTLSSPAFKNLVHHLDPKFHLESMNTYSNVIIPKMYSEIKEIVVDLLKPVKALTCTSDG